MIKDIAQVLCNVHPWQVQIHYADSIPLDFKDGKSIEFSILDDNQDMTVKWSQWATECKANYLWMVTIGIACCREFHYRNGEKCDKEKVDDGNDDCGAQHKMRNIFDLARENIPDLPFNHTEKDDMIDAIAFTFGIEKITPFPLVMPKKYISIRLPNIKGFKNISYQSAVENVVIESYQNYYQSKFMKSSADYICIHAQLAKWTNREKPEWLDI